MTKHSIPAAPVKTLPALLLICGVLLLAVVILWPGIDLDVSGWFYVAGKNFPLAQHPLFVFLHDIATYGARVLGVLLLLAFAIGFFRRKPLWKLDAKAWLFLLLGLVIAPGLIANTGFKDHWGRARPNQITQFGGTHIFSAALIPQPNPRSNGSFVAGDAAFGFYLPAFGYAVPRRRSRQVFWGGMGLGLLFGFVRIAMGAHFLSDVLFAALFMQIALAALHAAMYGRRATQKYWQEWLAAD